MSAAVDYDALRLIHRYEAKEVITQIKKLPDQNNLLQNREKEIAEVGILNLFRNLSVKQYRLGKIDEIIENLRKK